MTDTAPPQLGMVVNYYWKPGFLESTRHATALALQMLKESPGVDHILLVDGSPEPDQEMQRICEKKQVRYHAKPGAGFAAGWNAGVELLDDAYIGLMANDVFPRRETIAALRTCLDLPDVGCVFPYIDPCDHPGQNLFYVRKGVTCEPSSMTLNLNLFKREVLLMAGGISEDYSGSYNDVLLLIKMREMGFRVVLVEGAFAVHLSQMTTSQGSTYAADQDGLRFKKEHADLYAQRDFWDLARWKRPLATTRAAAILWWLVLHIPSDRISLAVEFMIMSLEPELTRFPAKFGTSQKRKKKHE